MGYGGAPADRGLAAKIPTLARTLLARTLLAATVLVTVTVAKATAQETGDTPVIVLDPVTVTARRFEEPVHQVPFGVSVVEEETLRDAGIRDTRDLYRSIPNFNFTDSGIPEANLLNIRGIGSSSALVGPSITYYVDGVPVPHRAFDQQFLDVERIEILRGPQGTLFGLNSQAGAVSLVTNDPSDRPVLEAETEVGSYDLRRLSAMASGPIGGRAAGRIAAHLTDRNGDIRNDTYSAPGVVSGSDEEIRDQTLGIATGKIRVDADEATVVTLAGRFQRDRQRPTTGLLVDDSGFPRNSVDPRPENDLDSGGASVTVEHDFGATRLTSLTGFQAYELGLKADITDGYMSNALTGLPASVFGSIYTLRQIDEDQTQWSQELRLDGTTPGGIRWVTGVSGLYSDFTSSTDITNPALANGEYSADIRTTNVAAFGEVTVPLAPRLRAIGGLRVTREHKEFDGRFEGRDGGAPAVSEFSESGDYDTSFATGRVGLSFDLTDRLSTFATVARGEKSGGFPFYNQAASSGTAADAYDNSSTWSYEVGLRGQVLGNRLELGTSVFFNDTTDEQLFTFNPVAGQFQVENADTQSYGAEVELTARPVSGLTFTGSLALLRAEITGIDTGSSLQEGNDVPYAPSVTTSLGAEYLWPAETLGLFGDFVVRAEYQYVGARQIDPANSYELDSYDIVNLRAGWMTGRFDVYTYAHNLFDTDYVQSGFRAGTNSSGQPVVGGVPGLPLTIGLGARLRF